MACNCKHEAARIEQGKRDIADLKEFFIRRMTVDSETHDARRRDFNQAIFHFDEKGRTYAVWNEIDMDMVLRCFDDAVKDWRRTFCDSDGCRRK